MLVASLDSYCSVLPPHSTSHPHHSLSAPPPTAFQELKHDTKAASIANTTAATSASPSTTAPAPTLPTPLTFLESSSSSSSGGAALLPPDRSLNQLRRAMELFSSLINDRVLRDKPIILVLSKKDLFAQTIATVWSGDWGLGVCERKRWVCLSLTNRSVF